VNICLLLNSGKTAIKMSPFEALYEYAPPLLTELPPTSTLSSAAQETLHDKEKMIQTNLATQPSKST
jgi:hypothetical protein